MTDFQQLQLNHRSKTKAAVSENNIKEPLEPYPFQIGGHRPILKHPNVKGQLVKPAIGKEQIFYETAQRFPDLLPVVPSFRGTITLNQLGVLEDLNGYMVEPCAMDVKIGRRLYDDDAAPDKKERMIVKSAGTTSGQMGFRISGIRYWDENCRCYVHKGKKDLQRLTINEIRPIIIKFLTRKSLAIKYVARLQEIASIVRRINGRFYASSILFSYDHKDPGRWECRMIDFVHCRFLSSAETITGPDVNYLEGLDNLIKYFTTIMTKLSD